MKPRQSTAFPFFRFTLLALIITTSLSLIYFIQSDRNVNAGFKILFTLLTCISAAVSSVILLRNIRYPVKQTVSKPDELNGKFYYANTWALASCLFLFVISIGTAVNGYFIMAFPSSLLFISFLLAGLLIKRGFEIDDAGNLFYISLTGVIPVNFNKINYASFIHYSSTKRFYLEFGYDSGKKISLVASELKSQKFKTYLNPFIIGEFVRKKCEAAGIKTEDIKQDYENNEWEGQRIYS